MPSGDASSGLISISEIQLCSKPRWLKRTSNCSRCERRFEGRQSNRAVLKYFDELPAHTEYQHLSKLLVDTRSDQQLVAVARDHALHSDALEVPGVFRDVHGRMNVTEGGPYCFRIR